MRKTLSFISIVILATLFPGVRLPGRPGATAPRTEPAAGDLPQIQSSMLRIEFDRNMRSRVVARLKGREVPLGAFSASETVNGKDHAWYDFAVDSQTHERVADSVWRWREAHRDRFVWRAAQDSLSHDL